MAQGPDEGGAYAIDGAPTGIRRTAHGNPAVATRSQSQSITRLPEARPSPDLRHEFVIAPTRLLTLALVLLVATLAVPVETRADATPPPGPSAETTTLEPVLVTGEQPGPGLWKVSKGDHVLWILGAQYPLPKKMLWRGREVEHAREGRHACQGQGARDAQVVVRKARQAGEGDV